MHYRIPDSQECECADCKPTLKPKKTLNIFKNIKLFVKNIIFFMLKLIIFLPILSIPIGIGLLSVVYSNHVNSITTENAYIWAGHHNMRIVNCHGVSNGLICNTTDNKVLIFEDEATRPTLVGTSE